MWFRLRPSRLVLPRAEGVSRRWGRGGHAIERRPVRVVEVIHETPRAVTLMLEPDDGRPFHFRAGQYLTHCFEIDGETFKRAYSLSAPEGGRLACTVQMIDGGVVSEHIRNRLRAGDRYSVIGPTGDFVSDLEAAGPLGFVAGGSGITPVMGLIETVLAKNPQRHIVLLYASRDESSIIFRQRLDALASRHPNLQVTHVLSQADAAWTGTRGRLDAARIAEQFRDLHDATFYLCGPGGLMESAESALHANGVSGANIRHERFLAAPRQVQRPTSPQQISFQKSRRQVTQQVGESILDAGLRESLGLRFSCTVGGCGACKVRVVSGEVAHNEPNCLTAEERAQGYVLACSAYALEPLLVEA